MLARNLMLRNAFVERCFGWYYEVMRCFCKMIIPRSAIVVVLAFPLGSKSVSFVTKYYRIVFALLNIFIISKIAKTASKRPKNGLLGFK